MLHEEGCRTRFKGALSDSELTFVTYACVDDTDLIEMAKYPTDSLEDVMSNMQKAMNTWGGMI